MQDALILILSIIGLFALYWALFGQWKWNNLMKRSEEKIELIEKRFDEVAKTSEESNKKENLEK